MAKTKTRYINLGIEENRFTAFLRRVSGGKKQEPDFSDIAVLRQLFSNEKARILHTIKTKNPSSLYALARLLERDFKSVREDVKLLERFGFIELTSETKGKRESLKPELAVDSVNIVVSV